MRAELAAHGLHNGSATALGLRERLRAHGLDDDGVVVWTCDLPALPIAGVTINAHPEQPTPGVPGRCHPPNPNRARQKAQRRARRKARGCG